MHRLGTSLIVGAVVVLGMLAAADALRGRGEPKASATPTVTRPAAPSLREMLRREAISGFIVYSEPSCVLHSLLLPRMLDEVVRRDDGTPLSMCRFTEGGGRYLNEGEVASPDGRLGARCAGGRTVVWDIESGKPERSVRGCPPAWRPDGRLTYPRGDAIMEEKRVLFTAGELRAVARMHPNVSDLGADVRIFVRATDLAWLDKNHLVVSLEIRVPYVEQQNASVLLDGRDVVGFTSTFGSQLGKWVVSQAGTFAAAEDGTIVERDGDFTARPAGIPQGRAVAFSPDEQWLAYVTGVSVYLIGTPRNSQAGRVIRLPVRAQDLTWDPVGRGSTGVPPRT
jgi:hypothetical protein